MTDKTLEVSNLSFTLDEKTIFKELSFSVSPGEIVLLCGRSGSGKSTLANLINGYYPEYAGKRQVDYININGQDHQDHSVVEQSYYVRTIFQHARLSFSMKTLREEMIFCLENNQIDPKEMDHIVEEKAKQFNLTYLLDRSFDDCSGGELQRAAFICADLVDAPLYVMDEPFANVDEETALDYIKYMKELLKKGKSIIVIDHQVKRWDWVERWLLIDSQQQLIDLSTLNSKADVKAKLIEEGILVEATSTTYGKPTTSSKAVLELDKVSVYHSKVVRKSLFRKEEVKTSVIDDASFSLKEGTLAALVGPSGSGKTSLFKSILNVSPFSGTIRLNGQDSQQLNDAELYSKVGIVFQDPSLQFVETKVLDEITLSLKAWNKTEEGQEEERAKELLSQLDFDAHINKSPWLLSQGQQRRLAVLCMTVGHQTVLLVDEPTYGQDAQNAQKIMANLRALCDAGITCLFTSHDRELVDAYAQEIYKIDNKKVRKLR